MSRRAPKRVLARDSARAAQFFGVSTRTVSKWIRSGLPEARKARFVEYLTHLDEQKQAKSEDILADTAKVAAFFGVPEPTVRRWRSQGLPEARKKRLEEYRQAIAPKPVKSPEKPSKPVKKPTLKEFLAVLDKAKKTGELPEPRAYNKDRDGRYTLGRERQEPIEAWLDGQTFDYLLETLYGWDMKNPPPSPGGREFEEFNSKQRHWVATAYVSEFGPPAEARIAGYKAILIPSLDHPKAAQANYFAVHTSGKQLTQRAAVDKLLKELSELADTPGLVSWVHSINLSHYRHKTQREITDRETFKRNERRNRSESRKPE